MRWPTFSGRFRRGDGLKRELPEWVNQEYGGHGSAWWEAFDQCRAILIEWARSHKQVRTYKELTDRIDAIPWPDGPHTHEGSQVGWLLGQVSAREWVEGRPLLSALVIASETKTPGDGFYRLAVELKELAPNPSPDRKLEYWAAEVADCIAEWKR